MLDTHFQKKYKDQSNGKNVIILPDEEYRNQRPYNSVFCKIFKWTQPVLSFTAITFCSELIRDMAISYKWISQPQTRNSPRCSSASIKIKFLLLILRLRNYLLFPVTTVYRHEVLCKAATLFRIICMTPYHRVFKM